MSDTGAPSGGKGAMALLTRKIGGVPVWAGAAVLGLGLGIYLRNKNAGNAAVDTAPADTTSDPTDTTDGTTVFASQTDPGNISPSTNAQWVSLGVRILVGLGYDGPAAQDALQHYVTAMPNTTDELAMVSIVQAAIGAPPQAIPISTTAPLPIVVGPTPYPPKPVVSKPPPSRVVPGRARPLKAVLDTHNQNVLAHPSRYTPAEVAKVKSLAARLSGR